MAAGGIGLGACGGSQTLSLSASEHLPPTISGAPGSSAWCTGMKKTADSVAGLGRGESDGIAARIVRNAEHRVESGMRHLPARSATARGLQTSVATMRRAVSDLENGGSSGLTVANHASAQITRSLASLGSSTGASC